MITTFETSKGAQNTNSNSGGMSMKTILMIVVIAGAAYFGYKYYIRKKQESTN